MKTGETVTVAVDIVYAADVPYTYAVPDSLSGRLSPGDLVTVPFGGGNRTLDAVVLETGHGDGENLKTVLTKKKFSVGAENLPLLRFIKSKCFCSLMEACRLLLPSPDARPAVPLYERVYALGDASLAETMRNPDGTVRKSCEKQLYVLELLKQEPRTLEDLLLRGISRSTLKTLETKNGVRVTMRQTFRNPLSFAENEYILNEENRLNPDQQKAFEEIRANLNSGGAHLLYGVTGSGKTHVFIALIDEILAKGKSCLLLIPEISLTFQIIRRLYGRYGDLLAVLHSGLSKGERSDEWERISKGAARVVVGTRSAVFAPVRDLGLIIIDEEQEHTYKSEMSPRYNAKDVALFRVHQAGGLLLLASATPSLESYYRAGEGTIGKSVLPVRYNGQPLPKVMTVDMGQEAKAGNKNIVSRFLAGEIQKNLDAGEQSILFLNRRGYAGFVQCSDCREVRVCPHCGIPLSYHTAGRKLLCHYCGYAEEACAVCPRCGGKMRYSGAGTQKAEEQLAALFPSARILRMDADSVSAKGSREDILRAFGNREYDILLGTQMITKGLDFPSVTLVGVLNADSLLYSSDFRAYERTFSLLTQVIGRAGRSDKSGRAVIQTFSPGHEVLRYAYEQDYPGLFENQLPLRKTLLYPPFSDLCQAVFIAEEESGAEKAAYAFIELLKGLLEKPEYDGVPLSVIRPTLTAVPMVDGRPRFRVIIKCRDRASTRNLLSEGYRLFMKDPVHKNLTVALDMNPQNIL